METLDASSLPPGFGFHPTDVELINHYLKRKILGLKNKIEVIPEVDIYKHEPWDLPDKSLIPSRDCKWHFFNTRDRKYPNGYRSNRATGKGYWKSTGKDRVVRAKKCAIGTKKTLVFHQGRPPHGKRTDWIMHEYYLSETEYKSAANGKDTFVLCRITKRNGLASEDEDIGTLEEKVNDPSTPLVLENYPKLVGATPELVNQGVKQSTSCEDVNDYEDWFKELLDPNFTTVPAMTDCGINLEVDSIFLAPKTEPKDLISTPDTLAVQNYNFEECELAGFQNINSDLFLENNFFPGEFFSTDQPNHMEDTDCMGYGALEHPMVPVGLFGNHGSICVDAKNEIERINEFGSTDYESPVDIVDTGIHIRQRQERTVNGSSEHRIRLQVHKMTSQNPGVLNHTVVLNGGDHHLDTNVYNMRVSSFNVKPEPECSKITEASNLDTNIKKRSTCKDSSPESYVETCFHKDAQSDVFSHFHLQSLSGKLSKNRLKRLIRELLKEIRMYTRKLFLGTCMMGAAAALTTYFLQENT